MLSVVIPTLNEAANLPATVHRTRGSARSGSGLEIIVSDCGSHDGTTRVARHIDVDRVSGGGRSRADALNRGARLARGEVLLFLHADSRLPEGFDHLIARALRQSALVGGAFDFQLGNDGVCGRFERHCLDWIVLCNRIRFRWTGNYYGDQAIFVRRNVFDRVGGFPPIALMEDIYFCRRMHRMGRTTILRPPVITSPRRFLAHGVIRQFAQDLALLGCDSVGLSAGEMWRRYNELNRQAHGSTTISGIFYAREWDEISPPAKAVRRPAAAPANGPRQPRRQESSGASV
jgi:rSAM/selenodomain-associated transferase 2